MRWHFEFPKKTIEIDESQISTTSSEKNKSFHVQEVLRGAGGGWLMYKNAFGEYSYLNLNKCIRIVEKAQ